MAKRRDGKGMKNSVGKREWGVGWSPNQMGPRAPTYRVTPVSVRLEATQWENVTLESHL